MVSTEKIGCHDSDGWLVNTSIDNNYGDTICPRSSDTFYTWSWSKWVTTSWTDSSYPFYIESYINKQTSTNCQYKRRFLIQVFV